MAAPVMSGVLQFSGLPEGGLQFCTHQPFHSFRAADDRLGFVDRHAPGPDDADEVASAAAALGSDDASGVTDVAW